jgi:predicted MFS family arabinose efflux permease
MSSRVLPPGAPQFPTAFRRLAWSNLAAQSAEQIGLAAAPLVAVLALGAGVAGAGLLQTMQTLTYLLLSLPVGVLADRTSRRRLMVAAEGARAASLVAIPRFAALGVLSLPLLGILGFVGVAGTVAYSITAPSLVPALVPRAALAHANGRLELARSIAFTAGPALGGALVGWTGASAAFIAAVVLSLAAVALLAGLDEPARPPLPARHPLDDLREGAGFVLSHALLRPVLLTAVFFNIAYFTLQAIYVPYAIQHLGLTASGVGATLAALGVGMIAAALLAPPIARSLPFGTVIVIGPCAGLAAALVMALTIWVASPLLAALAFFLIGAGPTLWVISSTTLRQAVTPSRMLGRVSAIITMATYGARPLGAAIGMVVGGFWGAPAALGVAALGFLVQAAVIFASPVPRLVRLPEVASIVGKPYRSDDRLPHSPL